MYNYTFLQGVQMTHFNFCKSNVQLSPQTALLRMNRKNPDNKNRQKYDKTLKKVVAEPNIILHVQT